MRNLGRILLIVLIFSVVSNAEVALYIDKTKITLGDSVTLRIEAQGEDITPPDIDTLCDVDIIASSTQQSIQIVNGNLSKSTNFFYTIEPEHNCTINAIPIMIDGKIERTKPVTITVLKQSGSQKDGNFILELHSDKKEVFLGESFHVDLVFKQKHDAEAIDSKFFPPKLDGFWIKYQSQPQKKQEGEYEVTTIHYIMAAQRSGTLHIAPAKIKIATREMSRDYWSVLSPSIRWKTYFSNPLDIEVKPLPSGIDLVGDFSIDFQVDKTTVHPNEAVNGKIIIKGDGNLEDIKKFVPYIPNANVFAKKP
ncbi:MAG: protein BatD, partial [Epsilonproteobacteria bacterium]|nr:protein BatD [Campylobacterota bacterium]